MHMACSMAFKLPMSSSSTLTNSVSSLLWGPSSSVAVSRCFSCSLARSSRKALSDELAFAIMLSSRSVTLDGEVGCDPIADTTTSLDCDGLALVTILAMSRILSAVAMQVPPNLSISQCAPRGQPAAAVPG